MNILLIVKDDQKTARIGLLEKQGFTVHATKSTLHALEILKTVLVQAVICEKQIQITDGLNFARWAYKEVGFLPPYFILSKKLTENDVQKHRNGEMITGILKDFTEIKNIKAILNQFESESPKERRTHPQERILN
ncbi:MAG: hypothetical protein OXB88_05605 [Bacteriovoracales bacterium]|nr:hypothetical protein [Bacteriovoracales bacterium]